MKNTEKVMDKIVDLCKSKGFVYPGSEIYGGLANTWDYVSQILSWTVRSVKLVTALIISLMILTAQMLLAGQMSR